MDCTVTPFRVARQGSVPLEELRAVVPALLASAALQGACIMVLSAIFSFWSSHLHPALPTIGFTATLAMFAAGNILGPAISGLAAGALGLAGTFVANAVISLATILLFPGKKRREALGDHTT